jgi:DNA modification methylase
MLMKNIKIVQKKPASSTEQVVDNEKTLGIDCNAVDTSLLYEDLCRQFRANQGPIEVEFREIVDWVRQGDRYTHHIHSYPAKLLPNIAHFFVRASSLIKQGSEILDPFSGSGTVALEASLAGHTPLIADSNPLSLLITAAKTTPFIAENIRETADLICKKAARYRSAPEIAVVNSNLWYEPKRKKELEKLIRAIHEITPADEANFFLTCFSTLTRKLSLADPLISVPVRLKTKPNFSKEVNLKIEKKLVEIAKACVRKEFQKICTTNIERVDRTNKILANRKPASVVSHDARRLERDGIHIEDGTIPLIITSPPYGSAQKYIRSSSLSLNWLGLAQPKELAKLEARSIGREHAPGAAHIASSEIPTKFINLLSKVKQTNLLRYEITLQYLNDMKSALAEMARVISPGGSVVIIVGNNYVCGEELDNDEYCISILRSRGLELKLHLFDRIKSRGLLTKRKSDVPVMFRESVLVFTKSEAR